MRKKFFSLLTVIACIWMDACLLFPALLTIYLTLLKSMPLHQFGYAVLSAYLTGALVRRVLMRKNRLLSIALSLAACFGIVRLFADSPATGLILALLCFTAAIRGIYSTESSLRASFPRPYCYISLFMYFAIYWLYGRLEAVQQFQRYILPAGLIAVPSMFLMMNSELLVQASREELKNSTAMPAVRRNNRLLIILTVLAGVIIAGFNTIKDAFLRFIVNAAAYIGYLVDKLLSFIYSPVTGGDGLQSGEPVELPQLEIKPPSPFWDILANILAYITLAVLSVLTVIFIVRQLKKLWRKVTELLKKLSGEGRWSPEESYGFSDEKESLIDWQAIRLDYMESIRGWLEQIRRSEPKWSQLTDNRQRVRYLYRHLLIKAVSSGYQPISWKTPNETIRSLAEQDIIAGEDCSMLEDLYGRARYGNGQIQDTEVEMLKKILQDKN